MLSQDAMLTSFGNILRTLTWLLVGIAAISLVVGSIGVLTVMWISVGQRTGEVGPGVLRARRAAKLDPVTALRTESRRWRAHQ